jgi:hypothetical protein
VGRHFVEGEGKKIVGVASRFYHCSGFVHAATSIEFRLLLAVSPGDRSRDPASWLN